MASKVPAPSTSQALGQIPHWEMHPDNSNPNKDFKTNYELKEELGKGGFGTVRRCIYRAPGVIRKELAAKINNTPEKKNEMITEARVCREVSATVLGSTSPYPSRFVVNFFDSITEGDIVYNMYEIASGGDLSDEIARKEFFQPDEAADAIRQILKGVNHIHERGWLHLDLKPPNILIQSKTVRIYKVADFGLAKKRTGVPGAYTIDDHGNAGTPSYRPPEVCHQPPRPYDTDFDIWSCGVILYEMLAGYTPFWEEDIGQMEDKIRNITYEFPSPEWDGLADEQSMIDLIFKPQTTRATYSQLRACRFFIRGNQMPVPDDTPQDVMQSFEDRRNLKLEILKRHAQAQIQQVAGQAQQQPQQPTP